MTENLVPIEQIDINYCLRKEFTLNTIQSLIYKGSSINLIGEKGTGKTRLLEDIKKTRNSFKLMKMAIFEPLNLLISLLNTVRCRKHWLWP